MLHIIIKKPSLKKIILCFSAKAKPIIVYENNYTIRLVFLTTPKIKVPKQSLL
jgi:hypothetical protein